jgi:hypothetical protein
VCTLKTAHRSSLRLLFCLFCTLALQTSSVRGAAILWNLVGVQFTDGSHATGSFAYDADTNSVSNIGIVSNLATYTSTASTFPVEPFEFVFIPNVPLVFGANFPALVLLPNTGLTDAGGTVALCCGNGFSLEGAICHDDCFGVITLHQVQGGSLVAVPEPTYAPLLAGTIVLLAILRRFGKFRGHTRMHGASDCKSR